MLRIRVERILEYAADLKYKSIKKDFNHNAPNSLSFTYPVPV